MRLPHLRRCLLGVFMRRGAGSGNCNIGAVRSSHASPAWAARLQAHLSRHWHRNRTVQVILSVQELVYCVLFWMTCNVEACGGSCCGTDAIDSRGAWTFTSALLILSPCSTTTKSHSCSQSAQLSSAANMPFLSTGMETYQGDTFSSWWRVTSTKSAQTWITARTYTFAASSLWWKESGTYFVATWAQKLAAVAVTRLSMRRSVGGNRACGTRISTKDDLTWPVWDKMKSAFTVAALCISLRYCCMNYLRK